MNVLNTQLGDELKEQGIAAVDANASAAWKKLALDAVQSLAVNRDKFTSDDVWEVLGNSTPLEPRALGPIMRRAAAAEWIEPTADFIMSSKFTNHRRPIRVWKSLV